jgi:hypothetical protein
MPMINGMWVDDSTGVPDQGMPPGMGDPTGGSVPPGGPAPAMTPPMASPQRPMPGQQMTPPSPQMQMLMNPAAAGIAPEAVSPELTPGMVNQEWNKINRPPEWDAGRIATTIASLPVTAPIQLIEGIRGLFGGDTIQGWAEQADARYSNPNYSESRAFGVTGVAKEPDYGDRWTGIITGRSQQGAMAGKLMRNEIGRYSKQRSQELKDFKYIGDIYAQGQTLQKNDFDIQHQPEDFRTKIDARRASTAASQAGTALSQYTLNKKQEDAATVQALANALSADPSLADGQHTAALMSIAKGNLNLVRQALEVNAAGITMPDPTTHLRPAEAAPLAVGLGKDIAGNVITDTRNELSATGAAQGTAEDQARLNAIELQKQQIAASTRDQSATAAALTQARSALEDAYKTREYGLPNDKGTFGIGGTSDADKLAFLQNLGQEKSRVGDLLNRGALSPSNALAIGSRTSDEDATLNSLMTSGGLDPALYNAAVGGGDFLTGGGGYAPPPIPTPTPQATPAALPTRVVPTPRPADKLPSAQGNTMLQDLFDRLAPPRKTPMATPTPSPSRYVDLNAAPPEATRAADATKEARVLNNFVNDWNIHEGLSAPKSGPKWNAKREQYLRANGIQP